MVVSRAGPVLARERNGLCRGGWKVNGTQWLPSWLCAGEEMVKPSAWSQPLGVRDAVVCFATDFYRQMLSSFGLTNARKSPTLAGALDGRLGHEVGVFHSFFGAPAAGMLLEVVVASGVRRMFMAGEAGSISNACRIGDILLPCWAVREEGTSYHYLPPGVRARCAGYSTSPFLRGCMPARRGVDYRRPLPAKRAPKLSDTPVLVCWRWRWRPPRSWPLPRTAERNLGACW